MEEIALQITEEYVDCRIDKCVSELMGDKLSRSAVQKLIKDNRLTVNGEFVKPSSNVKAEDVVRFILPDPIVPDLSAEEIPIEVLYEDENLLVVNKPKGMVVHPSKGHLSGTLVNALLYHCHGQLSGINGIMRPGIVHRIDKDTSGSLVVCKNDKAHAFLAELFKTHSNTRKYLAVCSGNIRQDDGTIHARIARDKTDRKRMCVTTELNAKDAITHYHVLERFGKYTYIECTLETGRTHQIRVHMSSIGHPLLGDTIYGGQDYKGLGQILHASVLGFQHPITGEYLETHCELPDYYQDILKKLRAHT